MAWDSCRQQVESSGDKMCDVNRCAKAQSSVDRRCHERGWPAGYPFGIYLPDDSLCFCCCSCFQYGTQIGASTLADGTVSFRAIESFVPNDPVLACGPDLKWATRHVAWSSGMSLAPANSFMMLVRYLGAGGQETNLIVTDDHLFLLAGKTLIPASALKTGDMLMGANGAPVKVIDAHAVEWTSGVHHISTGPWTDSLDGHLLNANGVVTGDAVAKIAFFTGNLESSLLTPDLDRRFRVGTPEYVRGYSAESLAFIGDPSRWPDGVRLLVREKLFNAPADAASFLTAKQAARLQAASTPRREFDSNAATYQIQYLFTQFKTFYPDTLFLFDWADEVPNGYAFMSYTQRMIVLSGGLLRLFVLGNGGVALIMGHLLARLSGTKCVGVADYEAADQFTRVYNPMQFPDQFPRALKQIEALFALIEDGRATDKCKNPTVTCREACFAAGAELAPVPPCADPEVEGFQVERAEASSLTTVVVTFNQPPNVNSAASSSNYALEPAAAVTGATVSTEDPATVTLTTHVRPDTAYVLTVTNVFSNFDEPLARDKNVATFTTGPERTKGY